MPNNIINIFYIYLSILACQRKSLDIFVLFHVLYEVIVHIFAKFLHNIQTDKSNVQLPSTIIIVKIQIWTQQRFVPNSYEKMSFKPFAFSFAAMLLIQPMVALIKSQNKNKVKCNAVVFTIHRHISFSQSNVYLYDFDEITCSIRCVLQSFARLVNDTEIEIILLTFSVLIPQHI